MPETIPDVIVAVVRETDTVLVFIELTFLWEKMMNVCMNKGTRKTGDNICESYA